MTASSAPGGVVCGSAPCTPRVTADSIPTETTPVASVDTTDTTTSVADTSTAAAMVPVATSQRWAAAEAIVAREQDLGACDDPLLHAFVSRVQSRVQLLVSIIPLTLPASSHRPIRMTLAYVAAASTTLTGANDETRVIRTHLGGLLQVAWIRGCGGAHSAGLSQATPTHNH